jgi:hypothetical protein
MGTCARNARGRLSDEDLDRFLADTNARRAELEEALDGLAGRRESAGEVERNLALLDEYLADLPHLLNLTAYERREFSEGVPEPYLLTPDTAPQPRPVDRREMAARWRRVYKMLDLRVTAYRDGTLIWNGRRDGARSRRGTLRNLAVRTLRSPPCHCQAIPKDTDTRGCGGDAKARPGLIALRILASRRGRKPSR